MAQTGGAMVMAQTPRSVFVMRPGGSVGFGRTSTVVGLPPAFPQRDRD
jgi:hypothetical protein